VITQNVDRLHQKAGSDGDLVLELHGTTHQVRCMDCDTVYTRGEVQEMIVRINRRGRLDEDGRIGLGNLGIAATLGVMENEKGKGKGVGRPQREGVFPPDAPRQNPDGGYLNSTGVRWRARSPNALTLSLSHSRSAFVRSPGDVEIRDTDSLNFKPPFCPACSGGTLKPDVVFFGDSLPKERTEASLRLARGAGGMLVVGSSLQVMSAFRLVQQAKEQGAEVFILTVGETRADALADYRIGKLAGELLPLVVAELEAMGGSS
jgi:NAD-dependent SIR2 family protein deacetylase